MKRKPKPRRTKLRKELDRLWSLAIRKKYPRCVVCGSIIGLSAHHCIVRKAQSDGVRWLLNNGVALCNKCHLFKLHGQQGDKEFLDRYISVVNDLIPLEEQENIRDIGHRIAKYSLDDLEDMIRELRAFADDA